MSKVSPPPAPWPEAGCFHAPCSIRLLPAFGREPHSQLANGQADFTPSGLLDHYVNEHLQESQVAERSGGISGRSFNSDSVK
jgi:hypothetical protein